MKKYEMYINKIKTGILNIDWDVTKKALAYSLAGIISATTLSGCSIKKTPVLTSSIETNIKFDSIDDELSEKLYFINSVLEEIDGKDKHPFYRELMEPYKKYKNIEYEIDSSNEYSIFYTEEEILNKKYEMKKHLNNAINIIERDSSLKFGEDYFKGTKQK